MSQSSVSEREFPRSSTDAPACVERLSAWTDSWGKRTFDIAAVLAFSPILLPLLVVIGVAVWVFSGTPVLFRQTRIGRDGKPFTIYKFRTMQRLRSEREIAIAVMSVDEITPLGSILRRFKLDELPQLFNVFLGEMSLVGPRPRIPEQQFLLLPCRPGLTGPATLAFAREETLLAQIPREGLPVYYRSVILPAKRQIDSEYMRRATFYSDLRILFDTVTGRWGTGSLPIATGTPEASVSQLRLNAAGAQQLE